MNSLKGVRSLVTPDLLYALAAASEGELILLAANNFPSSEFSILKNSGRRNKVVGPSVVRAGGLRIKTLLREIMKLIKVATIDSGKNIMKCQFNATVLVRRSAPSIQNPSHYASLERASPIRPSGKSTNPSLRGPTEGATSLKSWSTRNLSRRGGRRRLLC